MLRVSLLQVICISAGLLNGCVRTYPRGSQTDAGGPQEMFVADRGGGGARDAGQTADVAQWHDSDSFVPNTLDAVAEGIFDSSSVSDIEFDSSVLPDIPAISGKYVYITSKGYAASELGGLDEADALCTSLAPSSVGGDWKAWLSDGTRSPASRFSRAGPYVLFNGIQVAANWADLTDGAQAAAINITESQQLIGQSRVWTATETNGTPLGHNCGGWTSTDSAAHGTYGESHRYNGRTWTATYHTSCTSKYRIYCFQQ